MNTSEKNTFRTVSMLLPLAGVFFLFNPGCGEASGDTTHGVNEAQRLIRASQEQLPLSESEIESAAEFDDITDSQCKKIARRLVDRIEKQTKADDFEQVAAEMEQLSEKLALESSRPSVEDICELLARTCRSFAGQNESLLNLAEQNGSKRLDQAESVLQNVLDLSRGDDPSTKVAPELMLGTIQLARARRANGRLQSQQLIFQSLLSDIGRRAIVMDRESSVAYGLETFRPNETVKQLREQQTILNEQLDLSKKSADQLMAQKEQIEQELQTNQEKASKFYRDYLDLLEKARKKRGEQRYELQRRAYSLRGGTDQNPGGIYYEAQTELAQNRLSVINRRIAFQQSTHQRIVESLGMLSDTIGKLSGSPLTNTDIDAGIHLSRQAGDNIFSMIKSDLENISREEEQYKRLRVEAADAYRKAATSCEAAATHASARSHTRDYAKQLVDKTINPELTELWLADVSHYKSAVGVLTQIRHISEISQLIDPMVDDFRKNADHAQTQAAEYISEQGGQDEDKEQK